MGEPTTYYRIDRERRDVGDGEFLVEEPGALVGWYGVLVPVVPCEHGHIDPHAYTKRVGSISMSDCLCPGAGNGDNMEVADGSSDAALR